MTEYEMKEYIKCSEDTKYFLETYVQVLRPEGFVKLTVTSEVLQAVEFACGGSNRGMVMIDGERQVGKSTILLLAALNLMLFNSDKVVHLNTFRNDMGSELVNRLSLMIQGLPKWLQPNLVKHNKSEIQFDNGSLIRAGSSVSMLKGRAISLMLFDEPAFNTHFEEAFKTCLPAITVTGKSIAASTRYPGSFFNKLLEKSENKIEISRM